jgi:hypothetical protein
MAVEWIDTTCPECGTRFEADTPAAPFDRWAYAPYRPVCPVNCPECGYSFNSDDPEADPDDYGADDEPLVSLTDDGEPDAEGLPPVTCPHCTRRFEVGEPGPVRCPFCRHVATVAADGRAAGTDPLEPDCPVCGGRTRLVFDGSHLCAQCGCCGSLSGTVYDQDEIDDDYDDEFGPPIVTRCPNCREDLLAFGPGYQPPLIELGGRVKCTACRWEFDAPPDLQQYLADECDGGRWEWTGRRRCVTVSPATDSFFDPLAWALEKVGSPGRVVLKPGTYRGPLFLDGRDITVVADGPPGSVRIESDRGPCVVSVCGRVRLRGLTLVRHDRPDGWPEGAAVEADRAHLLLDRCRVQADGAAGLLVSSPGARALVRDCDLSGNRREGVVIERGAAVRLSGCRVTQNGEAGVSVDRGRAWLDSCTVADNAGPGLAVRRARPRLRHCRLSGNATPLWTGRAGAVEVEACDLTGNRSDAAPAGRLVLLPGGPGREGR